MSKKQHKPAEPAVKAEDVAQDQSPAEDTSSIKPVEPAEPAVKAGKQDVLVVDEDGVDIKLTRGKIIAGLTVQEGTVVKVSKRDARTLIWTHAAVKV